MGINNGGYRGLNEDVHRLLCLTTWSTFGGAVSSVALLEEVHYWGGLSEVKSSCCFQFGSLCFMLVVEDVSFQLSAIMPISYCYIPLSLWALIPMEP